MRKTKPQIHKQKASISPSLNWIQKGKKLYIISTVKPLVNQSLAVITWQTANNATAFIFLPKLLHRCYMKNVVLCRDINLYIVWYTSFMLLVAKAKHSELHLMTFRLCSEVISFQFLSLKAGIAIIAGIFQGRAFFSSIRIFHQSPKTICFKKRKLQKTIHNFWRQIFRIVGHTVICIMLI